MNIAEALQELRKQKKRNFSESIDLLVSLKGIDIKKENITTIISIPHKIKSKKVCAFLSRKSDIVNTISNLDFQKYKEPKMLKNLVKSYDFFIAEAKLMPSIATAFGKVLGPTGKMPSPQLGVLMNNDDDAIKVLLDKIDNSVKIRIREPAVKLSVGNQSMSDEELTENINAIYNGIINVLPTKKENVKSVMLKTTMGAPLKLESK